MSPQAHRSIGEVLHVLESDFPDVTISKIRFLESQGLLNPERTPSGYRKFYPDDVERLRWVLVQQRDNFLPLRVIKQRLDAGDWRPVNGQDPAEVAPQAINQASAAVAPASSTPSGSAPAPQGAPAPQAEPAPVAAPAPAIAERGPNRRPLDRGPSEREFTLHELADAAKIDISAIRDLHKFGVLDPVRTDPPIFDGDSLIIAKCAAGFMNRGLEARHLKSFRVAAEREAGTMEQLALPLSRSAGTKGEAVELANELATLGGELREAMIRRTLRLSLGLD